VAHGGGLGAGLPQGGGFPQTRAHPLSGALKALYDTGAFIIAGGGGGIPVVRDLDGTHRGVEAVIDKDRTSVLLACDLDVEEMLILTGVPCLYVNFGKPDQKSLSTVAR